MEGTMDGDPYRKIAWRLIPFLLACYATAIIDRFNIGFAKLQFLQDLKLDDTAFGLAAGAFSVGYVAVEVPSNLLLVRIGIRKTLLRIMVLWGGVTVLLSLAQNQYHLFSLRFLLGVAEGGFFPGILFYLTLWFPDRIRGRMTSLFVMAVPLGGIIAGPLSGLIMDGMQGLNGLHGWQWLFIIEGLPPVVLGVVAYCYLSDEPKHAPWLTSGEKRRVEADLAQDRLATTKASTGKFSEALREPRVYVLAFVYLSFFCSLNTILLWTPTILKKGGRGQRNRDRMAHGYDICRFRGGNGGDRLQLGSIDGATLARRHLRPSGRRVLFPIVSCSEQRRRHIDVAGRRIDWGICDPIPLLDDTELDVGRKCSGRRPRSHKCNWCVRRRRLSCVRRLAQCDFRKHLCATRCSRHAVGGRNAGVASRHSETSYGAPSEARFAPETTIVVTSTANAARNAEAA